MAAMEDVPEVYRRPHDPFHPVVAVDAEPVRLVADTRDPLPPRPGDTAKVDHEHARHGSAKGVRRLRQQFPVQAERIVYNASGMHLVASRLSDRGR